GAAAAVAVDDEVLVTGKRSPDESASPGVSMAEASEASFDAGGSGEVQCDGSIIGGGART
ncbi:MAG: hypothetical protein WKF75_00890, partial [Singulisphaera sp.]